MDNKTFNGDPIDDFGQHSGVASCIVPNPCSKMINVKG